MATFVILRHPVNILVTDLTNPDNLTHDLCRNLHSLYMIFLIVFSYMLNVKVTLGNTDRSY